MKVQELKEIIKNCVKTLQDVKKVDLKIAKYDLLKERLNAKICDAAEFLFVYKPDYGKALFFKTHFDLWVQLEDDYAKLEYSKCVLENMWQQIKKLEKDLLEEHISKYNKTDIDITLQGYAAQQQAKQRPQRTFKGFEF